MKSNARIKDEIVIIAVFIVAVAALSAAGYFLAQSAGSFDTPIPQDTETSAKFSE